MLRQVLCVLCCALPLLLAIVPRAHAQALRLDRDVRNVLTLDLLHPDFRSSDARFPIAAVLTARYSVSRRVALVGEGVVARIGYPRRVGDYEITFHPSLWDSTSPESTVHYHYDEPAASGIRIGNPYLGVEFVSNTGADVVELGVRSPLGDVDSPNPMPAGLASEVEKQGAFSEDVGSVTFAWTRRPATRDGIQFHWRLGDELWFGYGSFGTSNLIYRGTLQHSLGARRATLSIIGRMRTGTESGGNLADRSIHQVELGLGTRWGRMRPTVRARLWLDEELREGVPLVLALSVDRDF